MKSILKTTLVIFCALFLMQTAVLAQDKSSGNADKAAKASKSDTVNAERDSKIEYPEIEGWKKAWLRIRWLNSAI